MSYRDCKDGNKSTMANLKYYRNERIEFRTEFDNMIYYDALVVVTKKLCKHFKLTNVNIETTSGRNYSRANRYRVKINTDDMSFGTLCHELAHVYQLQRLDYRKGDRFHDKKHRKIMIRMLNYCNKKNYWKAELDKKFVVKLIKPEPTKDELKAKEIVRIELNLKRYHTKLKLYSNKIKKAEKRLRRLQKR